MVLSRRDFFTGVWYHRKASKKENQEDPVDYFSSIETCYAFLAEVPLEDLQQEALQRNMPFDGLSKFELAKRLFSK